MSKILTVGVAGGTGSGKTTLARAICSRFGGRIALLRHDDYYKSNSDMPVAERAKLNYDHPSAFDTPLLIEHIKALIDGHCIESPTYDYVIHDRSQKTRTVRPAQVVLVEGILIFENRELCDLLDLKIFVDTDPDVRLVRRILRDTRRRGRSLESVLDQYLNSVKPMHDAFVEPSKKNADIILPEGGKNPVALDMIVGKIEKHLFAGKKHS